MSIENHLTQREADLLLKISKSCVNDTAHFFPMDGGNLRIPLKAKEGNEEFILDIARSKIELSKNTLQTRARKTVILARLDLGGPLHRNPDGKEIPCPHIHLYIEGCDDKWAYLLPEDFSDPSDIWQTLEDFMNYCNVVEKPKIERTLAYDLA